MEKCIYRVEYSGNFRIYGVKLYNSIVDKLIDTGFEIYKDDYYMPYGIKVIGDDITMLRFILSNMDTKLKLIKW
jgi:hypothetical protein